MRLTDAAMEWHRDGIPGIPLTPRRKKPSLIKWSQYLTEAPSQNRVCSWWKTRLRRFRKAGLDPFAIFARISGRNHRCAPSVSEGTVKAIIDEVIEG